jgi:hypothetical protein
MTVTRTAAMIAIVAFCAISLGGCIWKAEWRDITGQNRGETASKADYDACYQTGGFPPEHTPGVTREAFDAAALKLKSCMTSKGWALVRAK